MSSPLYEQSQLTTCQAMITAIDKALKENTGDNVIRVQFPDGRQTEFHTLEVLQNMRANYINQYNELVAEKNGTSWILGRSVSFDPK